MIKNLVILAAIFLLWLAYMSKDKGMEDPFAVFDTPSSSEITFPDLRCEGKKECIEMLSCEEAKFYLRNCPDVAKLDPDSDGIPCEDICTNR